MASMGYCRFENTLGDLQDCWDHLFDDDLSEDEDKARRQLVEMCAAIADEYGDED